MINFLEPIKIILSNWYKKNIDFIAYGLEHSKKAKIFSFRMQISSTKNPILENFTAKYLHDILTKASNTKFRIQEKVFFIGNFNSSKKMVSVS